MRQSSSPSFLLNRSNSNANIFKILYITLLLSVCVKAVEDHDHDHDHDDELESASSDKFTTKESWLYGMLTGVMLGILGLVCSALVVFLKKYTKVQFDSLLKILIAFAAGALIGDAIIHLLPHAFSPHDHGAEEGEEEAEHSHETEEQVSTKLLSFFVCLGIFIFALIERIFHMLGIGHSHGVGENENNHYHHHHHNHEHEHKEQICTPNKNQVICLSQGVQLAAMTNPCQENAENADMIDNYVQLDQKDSNQEQDQAQIKTIQEIKIKSEKQTSNEDLSKCSTQIDLTVGWKHKKPEGYLNLIGDFLHNIMDGIALGVSFTSSNKSKAASTVVAIVAHEIPQEMGDVSILLNSNFSGLQAILCNGMVNFSGLIGIIIGISIASLNEKSERIMNCFIAGNFLFIGATEMLPKVSEEKSNRTAFLQLFGLCVGFGVMFLITLAEEEE